MRRLFENLSGIAGAALFAYAGYAGITYLSYGCTPRRSEAAALLDAFMPSYEVRERHHIRVRAPAEVTMAAAREISFYDSSVVRSIFALRALPSRLMGNPAPPLERRPIVEEVVAIGWQQLSGEPGDQVVMGAVTQPWKQNVEFRGLPPAAFTAFDDPGFAKIAWTLEVQPAGPSSSVFSTETRVVTTDPASREKFRRYWSFLSPGIILIRYVTLRLVKTEAEQRVSEA